jgi:hypothetical protein
MELGVYAQTYGIGRSAALQSQIANSQQPTAPTPQQQSVLASAVAAQRTAPAQQTQTAPAAQATGRVEAAREARSGTDTAAANDTTANALEANTSRLAVKPRGSRVDLYT